MSLFSYVRSVYALDTIDTRFTSSSTTPYKSVIDARLDPAQGSSRPLPPQGVPAKLDSNGKPIAQPSKWNTPEFYFYYLVFIVVVPYMFWIAYDVSRRQYTSECGMFLNLHPIAASDPNYHKYEHLLSPGWIPGRKIVGGSALDLRYVSDAL